MKPFVLVCLSLLIVGCSSSGKEEKELATQQFIDCDFHSALASADLAVRYAGDDVEIVVPAYLIMGMSAEALGIESPAYARLVELVPAHVPSIDAAKQTAHEFVQKLSAMVPDKIKACSELQRL